MKNTKMILALNIVAGAIAALFLFFNLSGDFMIPAVVVGIFIAFCVYMSHKPGMHTLFWAWTPFLVFLVLTVIFYFLASIASGFNH